MTILMRYDILTDAQTKFYVAETALAIHSVHVLNYVHRYVVEEAILSLDVLVLLSLLVISSLITSFLIG